MLWSFLIRIVYAGVQFGTSIEVYTWDLCTVVGENITFQ